VAPPSPQRTGKGVIPVGTLINGGSPRGSVVSRHGSVLFSEPRMGLAFGAPGAVARGFLYQGTASAVPFECFNSHVPLIRPRAADEAQQ
jgi:hypothetical protein